MTTDDVLDAIVQAEGGYVDHPADRGGATKYGITAQTLGEWRRFGRPASRAEVKALTLEDARNIYRARYVRPFDVVPFDALKAQLVDFGVLSGPLTAVRTLQRVLGVPVDGIFGPRTLAALGTAPWPLVNDALVGARVKLFAEIVADDPTQKVFLLGWINRTVKFMT